LTFTNAVSVILSYLLLASCYWCLRFLRYHFVKMAARWVPLESNPEVMTKYSRSLGAPKGEWVDVYGLSEDLLEMVPKPVLAVILLFPITPAYDEYCKDQDDKIKQKGQVVAPDLYYMKQLIPNACGTVGVIHALGNNTEGIELADGMLRDFLNETKNLTPYDRGEALHKADKLAEAHEEIACEGQTDVPSRDDQIITHFVAFVQKNGHLYELDGRREFPVNHCHTTPENLLKDVAKICEERIKLLNKGPENANEYRFSVVAYTTSSESE